MTDFLKRFLTENKDLLSEDPNNTDYQKLFDNWAEYVSPRPSFSDEDKAEFDLLYLLFKAGISLDMILSGMDSIPGGMFTYIKGKLDLSRYKIYAIEDEGFRDLFGTSELEEIILPKSLESIGSVAFDGCDFLKKVIFNDGLKEIQGEAFRHCRSLTEVNLPDSLDEIESGAFSFCSNLVKVSIPKRFEDQLTDIFYDDLKGSFKKGYTPLLKRKIDFELR